MSDVKEAANVVTSENLAEFHANKLGLAAETPAEAVAEEMDTEPVVEETEQNEPEPNEDESEAADKPKKANPKLEKRFSKLSKDRDAARQEAAKEREQREALEARLRVLEQQQVPQAGQQTEREPQPSEFDDAFEYAKALAKYEAKQIIAQEKAQEAAAKAAEHQQKVISTWAERVAKAKEEMPDYDEMVGTSDVAIHDVLRDAIIESDVGPKILYHLAENEDYAKKVAGMPLPQALKELGKLEARYSDSIEEKPVAVRKSKAPPPINPLKPSSAPVDVPIDSSGNFTGTIQQWKELRKAGKIR